MIIHFCACITLSVTLSTYFSLAEARTHLDTSQKYLQSSFHLFGSIINLHFVSSNSSFKNSCFAFTSLIRCWRLSSIFSLVLKYSRPF